MGDSLNKKLAQYLERNIRHRPEFAADLFDWFDSLQVIPFSPLFACKLNVLMVSYCLFSIDYYLAGGP
jgi:hypothetical protein